MYTAILSFCLCCSVRFCPIPIFLCENTFDEHLFFAFACLLLPFFRMSLYHSLNCQLKMREPNVCDTFFCCGYNFIRISIFENTCVHLNYSTIRVIIANWIRKCKSHPFIEERKRMKEKSKTSLRLFNSGPTLCVLETKRADKWRQSKPKKSTKTKNNANERTNQKMKREKNSDMRYKPKQTKYKFRAKSTERNSTWAA